MTIRPLDLLKDAEIEKVRALLQQAGEVLTDNQIRDLAYVLEHCTVNEIITLFKASIQPEADRLAHFISRADGGILNADVQTAIAVGLVTGVENAEAPMDKDALEKQLISITGAKSPNAVAKISGAVGRFYDEHTDLVHTGVAYFARWLLSRGDTMGIGSWMKGESVNPKMFSLPPGAPPTE